MGAVGRGVEKAVGGVTGDGVDGIVGMVGTGGGALSSPVNLQKKFIYLE